MVEGNCRQCCLQVAVRTILSKCVIIRGVYIHVGATQRNIIGEVSSFQGVLIIRGVLLSGNERGSFPH